MQPETAMAMVTMAKANIPLRAAKIDSEKTADLWFVEFQKLDDGLLLTAMKLALMYCQEFPTTKDIKSAINELRADLRYQNEPRRLPGYYDTNEARATIRKVREMLRIGDIPKAELVCEIRKYAKSLFPEISDEMIYRNYNELSWCQEWEKKCNMCVWTPKDCDLQGRYPSLSINKNGSMTEVMIPCKRRMAKAGAA